MGMKTSAVWADGTFESNTAPLMGPLRTAPAGRRSWAMTPSP